MPHVSRNQVLMLHTKNRYRFRLAVVMIVVLSAVSFAKECDKEKQCKKFLPRTVIGIGMVAGGTALSVLQYTYAKEEYSTYRKSAFTDNTEKLHKDVRWHDTYCVLGVVLASLGAITIVVDF